MIGIESTWCDDCTLAKFSCATKDGVKEALRGGSAFFLFGLDFLLFGLLVCLETAAWSASFPTALPSHRVVEDEDEVAVAVALPPNAAAPRRRNAAVAEETVHLPFSASLSAAKEGSRVAETAVTGLTPAPMARGSLDDATTMDPTDANPRFVVVFGLRIKNQRLLEGALHPLRLLQDNATFIIVIIVSKEGFRIQERRCVGLEQNQETTARVIAL